MSAPTLDHWISLLRSFASGQVAGDDFDTKYFALFRQANDAHDAGEPWIVPETAEEILGDFFLDVDGLSNDPALFPDLHVTEEELRPAALNVAEQLEKLRRHS